MHAEFVFVLLFAVATAVALVARWVKIPYTVALLLAGIALGSAHAFEPPALTKELLFAVFLPGLLFEAAFHLDYRKFWQNKIGIVSLAVPGLVVAIVLTAVLLTPVADALHFIDNFSYADGFLFAALIAATDPIAVVGLFKSLGAPKRLSVLIEGESLLNDGTAVVLFMLVLSVVTGGSVSAASAALDFVRVVGLGLGIGVVIGFTVSQVIRRVDDPMIEITLTTIAAYGSFIIAEQLHLSGVIATVAAGMLCGNYAARVGMSPSTRIAVESFWEYVAFALNSLIFLLIGFRVRLESLADAWQPIVVAFLAVLVARVVVVYVVSALLRRSPERIPWSFSAMITWGGLRGGLSMVLVLSLPESFAHREFLITLTFGVVVLSILLQGLTAGPLLRWLGLVEARANRTEYEARRGAVMATNAALDTLKRLSEEGAIHPDTTQALTADYQARLDAANQSLNQLHLEEAEMRAEETHSARRQLLLAEKEALLRARHDGLLVGEAFERLIADMDARLFNLERGEIPHDSPPPAGPPALR